jgi:prepilin peptidase CpaA
VPLLALTFFPLLMILPMATDLLTMKIPNWISLALIVGNLLLSVTMGLPAHAIALNFSCGAAVFALTAILFNLGWIGGGDAKLATATAVWIGWSSILDYGVAAALIGGLLGLAILFARSAPLPAFLGRQTWIARLHDSRSGIPYGIALAAAGLLQFPHTQIWAAAV